MSPADKTLLRGYVSEILTGGPNRVMISDSEGVPPRIAREKYGTQPDVIFIRRDGWSLGAPAHLEAAARRTWPESWIGLLRRPNTEPEELIE